MTTIIAVTVFLAAVIGFSLVLKYFRSQGVKTRENPVNPGPPPPEEPPEEELKNIFTALLRVNLMVRKDRTFPHDILIKIEAIIDDLKAVVPAMMERFPQETLTYEIKNIGHTHLYNIVKEYLDMAAPSRDEQAQTFNSTIADLYQVCQRARQIVDKNETAEFKTMAHFLAGKFSH